jgi:hypothetical protein
MTSIPGLSHRPAGPGSSRRDASVNMRELGLRDRGDPTTAYPDATVVAAIAT